jgi:hypothetical protein
MVSPVARGEREEARNKQLGYRWIEAPFALS